MIWKHRLILTLALGFLFSLSAMPQTDNYPIIQLNGKKYYVYTVQPSEGLYAVSRRFNVSQEDILEANPKAKDGLKKGEKLHIPIQNATISSQQTNTAEHTVGPGETVYSISKTYNTTVDVIRKLNPNIEGDFTIKVGSKLKVPGSASVVGRENTSNNYIRHTIKVGETLYSVSKYYNLTIEEVQAANPGLSPSNFPAGKVIRIGAKKSETNQKVKDEKEKNASSTFPYVVESKENAEDIAKKFNVSTDELKEVNPDLPKKSSPGDIVQIPSIKPQFPETPAQTVPAPAITQSNNSVPQIALLLPFMVNGTSNSKAAIVEYYEGFLMALNDAKLSGFSADVHVYDTKTSVDELKNILEKDEMKKMNLIIGPAYNEQVPALSNFSLANNIPLIIPLTSKNDSYQTNPNIYQITAPQSYLYPEVNKAFIKEFKNHNIIIVNTGTSADEKQDFTSVLASALKQEGIPYKNVTISSTSVTGLETALSGSMSNIIVPAFISSASLDKYMPNIIKLCEKKASLSVKLFGYPEWQTYGKSLRTEYLHPMDTYIFSGFYAGTSAATTSFRTDYMKAYGKDIISTFPKFALLGYDTGKYFLSAMHKYGYDFQSSISSFYQPGLQMDFHFERANYWSGFVNKSIYFIHFGTDSNVNATIYR